MDFSKYNTTKLNFRVNKCQYFEKIRYQLIIDYDSNIFWLYEGFFDSEEECKQFIEKNYKDFKSIEEEITNKIFNYETDIVKMYRIKKY